MLDRIEVRHIERIIRAQHHMIDAEGLHQRLELDRGEHHRVEKHLLQVFAWRLRQAAARIRSRPPGVVDAAGIAAEIAAARTRPGDLVLATGSRGVGTDAVVDRLRVQFA